MSGKPLDGDGKAFYLEHAPSLRLALGRLSLERKSYKGPGEEDEADVQQVEMLLEAYFIHMDNTFNRLDTMNEYISDTEVCCTPANNVPPFAGHLYKRGAESSAGMLNVNTVCPQEYIDLEINNFRNNLIRVSHTVSCKVYLTCAASFSAVTTILMLQWCACRHV